MTDTQRKIITAGAAAGALALSYKLQGGKRGLSKSPSVQQLREHAESSSPRSSKASPGARRGSMSVSASPFYSYSAYGVRDILQSIFWATSSRHLRRMLIASVGLAALTRRFQRSQSFRSFFGRFFLFVWAMFYRFKVRETPRLAFQHTHWNVAITQRMRLGTFAPVFYAFNAHAQTALCNVVSGAITLFDRDVPVEREVVQAFDGNEVHLDWTIAEPQALAEPVAEADGRATRERRRSGFRGAEHEGVFTEASPIVLILHGIFGDAEENYVRNVGAVCRARGWRAVVHWRWRLDFGESRDIEVALAHIQQRYPQAPIVAVGYSAGGHVLSAYLQAVGSNTPLVAAVIAAASFDLVATMDGCMQRRDCGYLIAALDRALRNCVRRHIAHDRYFDLDVDSGAYADEKFADNTHVNAADARQRREEVEVLLRDMEHLHGPEIYDRWLPMLRTYSNKAPPGARVPPMPAHSRYGRNTHDHYAGTAAFNMHKIGITTMILHADDDPVTPPDVLSRVSAACAQNPHIILVRTRRGGHVGWHEDALLSGSTWADRAVAEFFSGVFALHAQTSFLAAVLSSADDVNAAESDGASFARDVRGDESLADTRVYTSAGTGVGASAGEGTGDYESISEGEGKGDGPSAKAWHGQRAGRGMRRVDLHPSRIARIVSSSELSKRSSQSSQSPHSPH